MRHKALPEGWRGEIIRDGYFDWNPETEAWDLPASGVSVNFFDPEGNDHMTAIYEPECEELAWRAAYRIAYLHATGYFARVRARAEAASQPS